MAKNGSKNKKIPKNSKKTETKVRISPFYLFSWLTSLKMFLLLNFFP
jgi:hypothetical protein